MVWLHGLFAALCLVIGVLHLARLAVVRRDVVVEVSYAAMSWGMASMFSPLGDPVPAPVWVTVFLACAAWFAALMLRRRSVRTLGGEAAHFVIGSGAMLFMLAQGDHDPTSGAGHGGAATSAVALVLAAYFVLHTLRCADRWQLARSASVDCESKAQASQASQTAPGLDAAARGSTALAAVPSTSVLHSPRIPALAHLVITVGMAVMLVSMI